MESRVETFSDLVNYDDRCLTCGLPIPDNVIYCNQQCRGEHENFAGNAQERAVLNELGMHLVSRP